MNTTEILMQFVDLLMPELTPHEASMYIFLFRHSHLKNGNSILRIGQRTIAQLYGRGPKMAVPSRAHVLRKIKMLEEKGCIRVGDTTRDGTLYEVLLPPDIPCVIDKLSSPQGEIQDDWFTDPTKRAQLYERDKWICQFCGDKVTESNVTIDHFIPRCNGGTNQKTTFGLRASLATALSLEKHTRRQPFPC